MIALSSRLSVCVNFLKGGAMGRQLESRVFGITKVFVDESLIGIGHA